MYLSHIFVRSIHRLLLCRWQIGKMAILQPLSYGTSMQADRLGGSILLDDRLWNLWTCQWLKYALKGAVNIVVFQLCRYFVFMSTTKIGGRFPFWQAYLFKQCSIYHLAASFASCNVCQVFQKLRSSLPEKIRNKQITDLAINLKVRQFQSKAAGRGLHVVQQQWYCWWFRNPIPNHLGWCWNLIK